VGFVFSIRKQCLPVDTSRAQMQKESRRRFELLSGIPLIATYAAFMILHTCACIVTTTAQV
jgi:hypothetical protein